MNFVPPPYATIFIVSSEIDFFILETMNSIVETEVCLKAIKKFNIPIWVSFNLLNSKQIRSGEFLNKAIQMIHKYPVEYLLLNCNSLIRTINASEIISGNWSKKWGIYPNIGIGEPSPNGIIKNYHTDEDFLRMVDKVIELGVSVIGGCCGSSPKHINLIKNQLI